MHSECQVCFRGGDRAVAAQHRALLNDSRAVRASSQAGLTDQVSDEPRFPGISEHRHVPVRAEPSHETAKTTAVYTRWYYAASVVSTTAQMAQAFMDECPFTESSFRSSQFGGLALFSCATAL
jgi:hypothetical protein